MNVKQSCDSVSCGQLRISAEKWGQLDHRLKSPKTTGIAGLNGPASAAPTGFTQKGGGRSLRPRQPP